MHTSCAPCFLEMECRLVLVLVAALVWAVSLPAVGRAQAQDAGGAEGDPGPRENLLDKQLNKIWLDYQGGRHAEVVGQVMEFAGKYRDEPIFADVARRLYYLGTLSAVRMKDWSRVVEMAEDFDRAPGQSPGGWVEEMEFWRGVALQHVGRYAEARKVLVPFVDKFPGSPKSMPARFLIGATSFKENDFAGAADYFAAMRRVVRGVEWGGERFCSR